MFFSHNVPMVIVISLACVSCCHAQITQDPKQSYDSKIAFTSDRDGNLEIYTINPDGTDLTRLTNNAAKDGFPEWAPEGRLIAFVSDRDGEPQLFVISRWNEH